MGITPTKRLFRQCLSVYLLAYLAVVVLGNWEILSPQWAAFEAGYYSLLDRVFGWGEPSLSVALCSLVVLSVHMVSCVGMMWFKAWARSGFWVSQIAMVGVLWFFGPAIYISRAMTMFDLVFVFLFGAILLMAYLEGYGAQWFEEGEGAQRL